jgi:hypothetical protein
VQITILLLSKNWLYCTVKDLKKLDQQDLIESNEQDLIESNAEAFAPDI